MRISDWSSDVCSSDLQPVDLYLAHFLGVGGAAKFLSTHDRAPQATAASLFPAAARANRSIFYDRQGHARSLAEIPDRQSVVSGRRVSVRVDRGGRRVLKKNTVISNSKLNRQTQ